MMSYLEQVLKSQDLRFQAALAEAGALYHFGKRGAEFEEDVRGIIQTFLPATYCARDVLLDNGSAAEKQLDLVVHPAVIPPLLQQLPIDLITAVGEIKTRLTDKKDIRSTAEKISHAAAKSPSQGAVPLFVLAGALRENLKDHPRWLAELIASITSTHLPWPLWPAVFSFDENGPMSALHVTVTSPIRAVAAGGEFLHGVVTIPRAQLSPSAVFYLWIWAAIYATETFQGMDFRFMRDAVQELCAKEGGIDVLFYPDGDSSQMLPRRVSLLLPENQVARTIGVYAGKPETTSEGTQNATHFDEVEVVDGDRRVMLITLGSWVDEPDSWDESPWGGSATATRRGYGYYTNMPEQDLLDACRLFWKFNPKSPTWYGIDHAVVAHGGRTRAAVKIDRFIGPFWGRYGFRGHMVTDPVLARELVGRKVPRRQNPITTIGL